MAIRLIAGAFAEDQSCMLIVETQLLQGSKNLGARFYAIRYQREDCDDRLIVAVYAAAIKHVANDTKFVFSGGCNAAGLRYDTLLPLPINWMIVEGHNA
jgi:hypothetical protein